MVQGLSAISVELARVWGIPSTAVAEWNVCKYMARANDPLPYRKIVGRIFADTEQLEQWAQRQVKTHETQPQQEPQAEKAEQAKPTQQAPRTQRTEQPTKRGQAQQPKRSGQPVRNRLGK